MEYNNKKKTVLIVDDERPIRTMLSRFIGDAGYQTLTAESVAHARQVLEENPVDLVITDLKMPKESGLVLIQHIKELYPAIGVLVATALDNPGEAQAVLEAGVFGYIVKPFSKNLVLITVDNAMRRVQLEIQAQQSRKELELRMQTILDNIDIGLMLVNVDCIIIETNSMMRELFADVRLGDSLGFLEKCNVNDVQLEKSEKILQHVLSTEESVQYLARFNTSKGERDLQVSILPVSGSEAKHFGVVFMLEDLTEKIIMEQDLHNAQKLEAIGQLAAGIAHEINTPVQYVGDNIRFISDAYTDIQALLDGYEKMYNIVKKDAIAAGLVEELEQLQDDADILFLREEIPATISQSLEGVARIATIVKAMKEFSHPGTDEKIMANINKTLESTIAVSRNEWKYVAEVKTDFAEDLPLLSCYPSELNQVFLNMVVNSAHAIASKVEAGIFGKGLISLATRLQNGAVVITIADNGSGMPEAVQQRIYEPFFTTKQIGKGTGQGLTIARGIVEDKHEGSITCATEEGKGTSFVISLPV